MLSQLKIFLFSSIGLEMKYEMLSVDTISQSSNIPEPALSWKGEGPGGRNTPRSWKSNRGDTRIWTLSFPLTMKINVLK